MVEAELGSRESSRSPQGHRTSSVPVCIPAVLLRSHHGHCAAGVSSTLPDTPVCGPSVLDRI